ncbi:MAG: 3-dehydroquinate synthase [Ignavibacteriales bacterium]|nr:3-dehydroquinate synthase [Ignavibacteriales bacterium]
MKKIDVKLKTNPYSIFVGKNILSGILKKHDWKSVSKILIITDSNIAALYTEKIKKIFQVVPKEKMMFVIKAGEESKSSKTLSEIYSFLIQNNYGRDSFIVALGGGVVGDISGYAAATYMRGISYCQVPTTLLAAVDSSVGGKTGVNFLKTKNIVGAFYQPKFVVADLDFLTTLPAEEWTCGLGEVLKYCFLSDSNSINYFQKNLEKILNNDLMLIEKIIIDSVKIKSAVVTQDEKELGLRQILNLGHTFAHGFESLLKYKIKHGEAVIAGIGCSIILSYKIGILSKEKFLNFVNLIKMFEAKINLKKLNKNKLYDAMLKDKKNKLGKIKFVLLKDIGQVLIGVEADKQQVMDTFNDYTYYFENK